MKPEIIKAKKDIENAKKILETLIENCNHTIVPSDPKDIDCSSPICEDCGFSSWSWYCPKNPPTHECEYKGDESCIYCMQPMERK